MAAAKQDAEYAKMVAGRAKKTIQERTDLNTDIAFTKHSHTHVIVMGRYKNRDYVEVFSIRSDNLNDVVPILRDMQEHAKLRHADGPISLKEVLNRECKF